MKDASKPSLLDLLLAFVNVGLTSVGGAAAPARFVLVKQRGWLSETELAELFGIAQALPGPVILNTAVMLGDRYRGTLGALAGAVGLIVPSLVIAIVLSNLALHFSSANVRFASAETAITAAVAGTFISNGVRTIVILWREPGAGAGTIVRSARLAISALGILLIAGFHAFVPLVVALLVALSVGLEWRIRAVR